MSLDQNLFTLIVTPNKDDANVIDLVDRDGNIHYRKQRIPGAVYTAQLYDFTSQSLLCSATAPNASSKTKILELFNPSMNVELKYTGTLTFRWSFKFEDHEFEWKREECFMIRKPDPPVLVAITKEPPGRLKTSSVQILDYNLNRFDIDDRKGLEIVILTALLTFQDANETYHLPTGDTGSGLLGVRKKSAVAVTIPSPENATPAPTPVTLEPPPLPPPKPAPKTGTDRIAEVHAIRGDVNEITVEDEGTVGDYAQYVSNLLQDDAMLFVSVRSAAAEHVPKVIQIVEETKRMRHRAGISEESELHQYVVYDTSRATKGPRIINLDDPRSKNKYTPPTSLTIHLSKIPMPELQPKAAASATSGPKSSLNIPSSGSVSPESKPKKDDKKAVVASPISPSTTKSSSGGPFGFLRRRRSSSPVANQQVPAHQTHPIQPSPSPAQLNNPMIYTAPPPPPPQHTRPTHGRKFGSSPGPSSQPLPQMSFPEPGLSVPGQSRPTARPLSTGPSLYGSYAPPLFSGNSVPPPVVHSPNPMHSSNTNTPIMGFFNAFRG